MSRPLRIEYPGAFYHVMNRGIERRSIFIDPAAHRFLFKNTLRETVAKWKIKIHAYSLMSNHYHLLIETPLGNISRAMRHIDGVYTQRLNKSVSRDGPIFRGRFKSILVEKESYFLELVRYIHLNGVRAKLYPSAIHDPNGSHRDYLNPKEAPHWLEQNLVLSYFNVKQHNAIRDLDSFICAGVSEDLEEKLSQKRWPAILGVKEFIEKIKQTHIPDNKKPHPEIPEKRPIVYSYLLNPESIIKVVFEYFQNRNDAFSTLELKRAQRWALIWALREYGQVSFNRIGKIIGSSKRSTEKFFQRNDFSESQILKELSGHFRKCRM